MFAQGRISLVRGQPARAIEYYKKATAAQQQYRNLHLISFWEIAIANLALWDIQQSLECWAILKAEATVSRSRSYIRQLTHFVAVVESDLCFWCGDLHGTPLREGEEGGDIQAFCRGSEVDPTDCGKIYSTRGLSVSSGDGYCFHTSSPQKYAAKRAEKFQEQGGRLTLAALELTYVFGGIAHAQRGVIVNEMLPQTRAELSDLKAIQNKPEAWGNGKGYWDDYCLCRFLEGVCERYLAYPVRAW